MQAVPLLRDGVRPTAGLRDKAAANRDARPGISIDQGLPRGYSQELLSNIGALIIRIGFGV